MPKIDEVWEGGYARKDAKGRKWYTIRRSVNGRRFEVSTRCTTLKGAMEQLKRFEADPDNYTAAPEKGVDALYLTNELVESFLSWSRDVKKNTDLWRYQQRQYLEWWCTVLYAKNLRKLKLIDLTGPLDSVKARPHRIAVIKAFLGWLRKEKHLLEASQDPTIDTLVVPPSRPEQWTKVKTIPKEAYLAVRQFLPDHFRAAVDIQAGTGWHVTEVIRFAASGTLEAYAGNDSTVGGVLLCPRTKSGEPLRTAVSAVVAEAAKQLLAYRGRLIYHDYWEAIRGACLTAKVEPFTPGRFRHSVATWAINAGANPAAVSAFLNHKDSRTTRRFYATHATPAKVPTLV